jgi:Tfp pilus assembly protein PilO
MSPQGTKLSTVNASVSQLTQKNAQLQIQLQTVEHESKLESKYAAYLTAFSTAVPPTPDAAQLTTQIAALADSTKVNLNGISDDTIAVATPVSTIPITMTITGTGDECLNFLKGIYKMPRLITISSFIPTPGATPGSGSSVDVLTPGKLSYTFALSGEAYYSPLIDPLATSSSTTTTTG